MLIYLVEDDDSIRELVAYTLGSVGFRAEGFESPPPFGVPARHSSLIWFCWI